MYRFLCAQSTAPSSSCCMSTNSSEGVRRACGERVDGEEGAWRVCAQAELRAYTLLGAAATFKRALTDASCVSPGLLAPHASTLHIV
jgi:hypothetical protein